MKENQNQNEQWKLLVLILKEIAESKGITQEEIAKLTGMQQSAINRFMLLKYRPRLDTFLLIAKALNQNFTLKEKYDN